LRHGLVPVCRAEHRSFRRDKSAGQPICMRSTRRARHRHVPSDSARRGAARKPRVARGPWTALLATPGESEERRREAATGRLLTRAFLALALRAPLASQSAPSGLVFGYFFFDCTDAGGRATQEQLPRRRKRKYLAFGCENPIQVSVAVATLKVTT
jgi:hypothetical protein